MPKGNEDLKAKIAKIQQKGKLPDVKAPAVQEPMPEPEQDMEALEAEFEAKKKALMQKKASQAEPAEADGAGLQEAIAEYADEAKFRVEVVFQLVQLNKSFNRIADALEGLVNNGEE